MDMVLSRLKYNDRSHKQGKYYSGEIAYPTGYPALQGGENRRVARCFSRGVRWSAFQAGPVAHLSFAEVGSRI